MQLSDLCIFTEPQQGASYDTLLTLAQRAEAVGFGGFFRSDHFLKMGSVSGLPGPTDAWVTLGGLARETSTIRLGTLVSPVTFRGPGLLAISVAQVDQMSGGRIELGIGAGWYEAEHTAYAFDFPDALGRFDNLTDQLAIIDGLWNTPAGETFSYSGNVHSVANSPGLPKPVQQPLPIIIGGGGKTRTPALTARYAAECNVRVRSGQDVQRTEATGRGGMRGDRPQTADAVFGSSRGMCRRYRSRRRSPRRSNRTRAGRAPQERCGRHGGRGRSSGPQIHRRRRRPGVLPDPGSVRP